MHRFHHAAIDLTVGSPLKRILIFMLPMLIGNIFQQLYAMVDTIIVGQTLGADALTGVGSTGAISFMILGFVSGLTHGFSVMVSQRRGARDEDGMRRSFATGIALTVVLVSLLTIVAVSVAGPLLRAMNTQEQFLPYAERYITVIFGGMLLSALYNQFSSTLRAIGDSVVPLFFLILSSFLNAGMDCLFIMVFDMGVGGAATATVAANGISALLTFVYMWVKYPQLRPSLKHFKPNARLYIDHIKLGLPMALQLSVISIGMVFGQTALNTMDPTAVTAYTAATKIDGIASGMINTASTAAATYVGQNYGAKRYDRIRDGMRKFMALTVAVSIVLGAVVLALHRPLIMMFIDRNSRSEALYGYALNYLWFNAGFYVLLALLVMSRSSLQGMGRGTLALCAAVAEVVMRVVVAILAMHFHSYTVVCMLNCSSWLGATLFLLPTFLIVLNKYIPLRSRGIKYLRLPNPSDIPYNDNI